MEKRTSDKFWFPWWPDKWIFGSVRIECTPAERGIWVDLLSLASKDNGHIRANEETPYPLQQLAGMLIIPEKELDEAIKKFIKTKKLIKNNSGTLYIAKWDKYQFSERHKRRVKKQMSANPATMSGKKDAILHNNKENKNKLKNIIDYFNEITGQKRSYSCKETNDFINGRLNEGRTLEDFKHVIDTKTAKWKGQSWIDSRTDKLVNGNDFLRPSTLFRPGNFEDYLNEPHEDPKRKYLRAGENRPEDKLDIPNKEWQAIAEYLFSKGKSQKEVAEFYYKATKLFPKIQPEWDKSDKKPETFIRLIEGFK